MDQIKYDVFLSYSHKDYVDKQKNVIPGNVVSIVKDALTEAGITYWFDEDCVYSGNNFIEKIVSNIEVSQIFVFLSTVNANKSRWTCKEIASADEFGKYIIPVRIDHTPYNKKVMFRIADLSFIDYFSNPEKGIRQLITTIKKELERIQEEANRKKAEEVLQQEHEKELIKNIKFTNESINNEESKLQLKRDDLLLQVDKVTDSKQRNLLINAINAGGAIHLKYQKEQTTLNKELNYNKNLVKQLRQQIKETNDESEKFKIYFEEKKTELEQALSQIQELDKQLKTIKVREIEYKEERNILSKKIKELQTQLIETQSSRGKGKSKLVHIVYCIIILLLIISFSIFLSYVKYNYPYGW